MGFSGEIRAGRNFCNVKLFLIPLKNYCCKLKILMTFCKNLMP